MGATETSIPGISLRPFEEQELEFLYRVYAASRDREMALVTHWSADQS